MDLYHKYRPSTLEEVIGNVSTVNSIKSMMANKEIEDMPHAFLFSGPSGCLRGDMPIFDPVDKTTISIRDRWKAGRSFSVFSWSSDDNQVVTTLALPPDRYPRSQILRVETQESFFYATPEHRVLLDTGEYLSLKELSGREFSYSHLLSIEEPSRVTQPLNDRRYSQTTPGFQFDYPMGLHSYDGQPHFSISNDQEISQELIGALGRILHGFYKDVLGSGSTHTHQHLLSFLLSKIHSFFQDGPSLCWDLSPLPFSGGVPGYAYRALPEPFLSPQPITSDGNTISRLFSAVVRIIDDFRTDLDNFQEFSHKHLLASHSSFERSETSRTIVKRITEVGQEEYFDFHVPGYNNYWMEGLIHHNCGKTSLARILAADLGCNDHDLREVDIGDYRGIDTVREIRRQARLKPMAGPVRVWILDECFAAGTQISTPKGKTSIEDIARGDIVCNLEGIAPVTNTFQNKVGLDRVVRVHFQDGNSVISSKEHRYLTDNGWVPAIDLRKNDLTFCFVGDTEGGYRGRWESPQLEKRFIERQKEKGNAAISRVDYVEVYQRGSNDESFRCIIGDQERDQGFVTFYDFEVKGHHSYYANDVLVHNCHMLTKEAQNALLKILEDPPKHSYFMLATTEPTKLLPTIRSRCTPCQVSELVDKTLRRLVKRVCTAEGKTIPRDALNRIATNALGSPRAALVMLDKVIDLDPDEMASMVESAASEENQVIDLCRALIGRKGWKEVSAILRGLKEQEPEGCRRMVLGYFAAVLAKSDNSLAFVVMEAFEEPFFNTGYAGLVLACYRAVNG